MSLLLYNISLQKQFRRKRISPAVKFILLAGLLSLACTTRVSEWILLNSIPESYSLIYFHKGALDDNIKRKHNTLRKIYGPGNIIIGDISQDDIMVPYYALYYNKRLFAKYNSSADLENLASSPLRKRIAEEIMSGKLCVMLYLKTDNKQKDEKGLNILKNALNVSPFRDIITVFELSRNSRDESHFTSFLLHVEDDLTEIDEPMLFGIFGRFRALEPLLAGGITGENINYMIGYMTAECSCLIKDDLPGTNILYSGSWENPGPALLNRILDNNPMLAN
jgi:hypothetical protein